jgi:hypothetical protein
MTNPTAFPERDWRALRGMKDTLLQRASTRALERVERILTQRNSDPHQTYLELWRTLETEDEKIARMFDDLKRSNALWKMAEMIRNGRLTPEETGVFTPDTRAKAGELAGANKALHPTGARRRRAPAGER